MHLLYIHQHFATPNDTLGTRSYEFSRELIKHGHTVTMVCGATAQSVIGNVDEKRVIYEEIDGIQVIRVSQEYLNSMSFISRIKSFCAFAFSASKIVRQTKADLVFATSTPLTIAIPGIVASRKWSIPLVFEVRDLWPELPVAMGVIKNPILIQVLKTLELLAYKRSTSIVALAPGMKDGILKRGIDENKISVIPNGCDLELFDPSQKPVENMNLGDKNKFRAVYCGHHGIANNLQVLLEVAQVLKQRGITSIQFVLIGGGSEKAGLIKKCKDLQLEEYFVWQDPIPKKVLAQAISDMDLGLMLLKNVSAFQYGTSPNKFFDYLAAGLPILNNYPGWIKDLLEQHDCGIAVPPDSPEEFADGLVTLLNNPVKNKTYGINARTLAEHSFSREKLAQEFLRVVEKAYVK